MEPIPSAKNSTSLDIQVIYGKVEHHKIATMDDSKFNIPS